MYYKCVYIVVFIMRRSTKTIIMHECILLIWIDVFVITTIQNVNMLLFLLLLLHYNAFLKAKVVYPYMH